MFKQNIFGPPGTGKTTYLLNLVEEELKTYSPMEIAFVSFTRKGTYEGASRAKKKFGLKEHELRYFRTLHSLCFQAMGVNRLSMITKQHYKLLSQSTGINFTGYYTEDFSSTNDEYLHVMSMEKHNQRLAIRMAKHLNDNRFKYIKFQYNEMKKQLGIQDFDDLLTNYLEHGKALPVRVAFIDEVQDLTPLQWQVAMKMFSNVDKIYIAGDDDQAVYEWSGADVSAFLKFTPNSVILDKSYRLPEEILKIAKRVTRDIYDRKSKNFIANGTAGAVEAAGNFNSVSLKGGELVLARTNYVLRGLSFTLMNKGIPFKFKGKPSIDKRVLKAIETYNDYYVGAVDETELLHSRAYFDKISRTIPWQHTLKLPDYQISYYEKVIKFDRADQTPVLFETFHSCKGSENTHVILSPDITTKVMDNFYNQRDSELRCLYVGLTRAKEKLTFLSAEVKEHYPYKYFN